MSDGGDQDLTCNIQPGTCGMGPVKLVPTNTTGAILLAETVYESGEAATYERVGSLTADTLH